MARAIANAFLHRHVLRVVTSVALRDRYIVDGKSEAHGVACISFDCESDEDMKIVPLLLEKLDRRGIKTSFALSGKFVRQYSNTVGSMLSHGHEIINHTFSHPERFASIGARRMKDEIESFQDIMAKGFGYRPQGFRAPHLMRKLDSGFFGILRANRLYDSSYVGHGATLIDGVIEIPLTSCPDHSRLCFDHWHHFETPLITSTFDEFLRLWERMFRQGQLVNVFFDPYVVSDLFLREILIRVPRSYRFCRLADLASYVGDVQSPLGSDR